MILNHMPKELGQSLYSLFDNRLVDDSEQGFVPALPVDVVAVDMGLLALVPRRFEVRDDLEAAVDLSAADVQFARAVLVVDAPRPPELHVLAAIAVRVGSPLEALPLPQSPLEASSIGPEEE